MNKPDLPTARRTVEFALFDALVSTYGGEPESVKRLLEPMSRRLAAEVAKPDVAWAFAMVAGSAIGKRTKARRIT